FLPLTGVARRLRLRIPSARPETLKERPHRTRGGARTEPALGLEVELLETREGVLARLRGEAGVAEAGALETTLLGLAARRPAGVTLDLSELRSLSSLATGVRKNTPAPSDPARQTRSRGPEATHARQDSVAPGVGSIRRRLTEGRLGDGARAG